MCKYFCGYSKSQVTGALNNCLCSHFASLFKDVHIGQKKVGCGKKREQLRPETFQWPKTVKGHYSLPLDNCNSLGGMFCPASSSLRYPGQGRLCLLCDSMVTLNRERDHGVCTLAQEVPPRNDACHFCCHFLAKASYMATPNFKEMGTCNITLWTEEEPEVFDEQCWWPPQFLFSPCWISGRDTKSYCPKTYS